MKRLISLLFASAFLLLSVNAYAFTQMPFSLNVNAVNSSLGDDDGITELIREMSYDAVTTSQIDTNTGNIVDSGSGYITFLTMVSGNPSFLQDNEGFYDKWGISIKWDDLTGTVDSIDTHSVSASYTSGTINFYLDDGSTSELVMTLEVYEGDYTLSLDGSSGSSYTLYANTTYLLDGWMLDENGNDLSDSYLNSEVILAYSAGDNDPKHVAITTTLTGYQVVSDHNSSLEFNVAAVPEPTTLALFGIGLLSLAGITRRKHS